MGNQYTRVDIHYNYIPHNNLGWATVNKKQWDDVSLLPSISRRMQEGNDFTRVCPSTGVGGTLTVWSVSGPRAFPECTHGLWFERIAPVKSIVPGPV